MHLMVLQISHQSCFPEDVLRVLLLAAVSVLLASRLSAQPASDDALVESLYPKSLTAEVQNPTDLQPSWRFKRVDLDGTGSPTYIVALYANGARAVLRIISVTGNSATVVAAPADPMLDPFHMGMQLIDLDGDGKPEILLSSGTMRKTENWIFAWRNHTLVLISPARALKDGTHISLIPDVRLVDVDGDEIPELLTEGGTNDLATTYKLVAGAYQRTNDTLFTNEFVRGTGEPDYWDIAAGLALSAADLKSRYELRVINGTPTGIPVTSATITLNGKVVFKPNDFKNAAITIKVPVSLIAYNELEVELSGKPDSSFRIVLVRAAQ
jgi:hypothetical protein